MSPYVPMFCLRLRAALIVLAATSLLAGCTTYDVVSTASRPGKFRLYSCDQLDKRGGEVLKRETCSATGLNPSVSARIVASAVRSIGLSTSR